MNNYLQLFLSIAALLGLVVYVLGTILFIKSYKENNRHETAAWAVVSWFAAIGTLVDIIYIFTI